MKTPTPRLYLDTAYRAADVTTADQPIRRDSGVYHDLRTALVAVRRLDAEILDRIEETVTTDDERDLLDVVRIMLCMDPSFPCRDHEDYDDECSQCRVDNEHSTLDARSAVASALDEKDGPPKDDA